MSFNQNKKCDALPYGPLWVFPCLHAIVNDKDGNQDEQKSKDMIRRKEKTAFFATQKINKSHVEQCSS